MATATFPQKRVIQSTRFVLKELAKLLKINGLTYRQIEAELNLRPNSGMTAYRLIHN